MVGSCEPLAQHMHIFSYVSIASAMCVCVCLLVGNGILVDCVTPHVQHTTHA